MGDRGEEGGTEGKAGWRWGAEGTEGKAGQRGRGG